MNEYYLLSKLDCENEGISTYEGEEIVFLPQESRGYRFHYNAQEYFMEHELKAMPPYSQYLEDVVNEFVECTVKMPTQGDKYAFAAGFLSSTVARLLKEVNGDVAEEVIEQLTRFTVNED